MKLLALACVCGLTWLGLSASARADTVTLKDGTTREGLIVKQDGKSVTLEVRLGGLRATLVIPREEIASIQNRPLPADPAEAQAAKLKGAAEALKGTAAAEAWIKLADYYASCTGYSAQAAEACEKALQADLEYAPAHQRLGHLKTRSGWLKTDNVRRVRDVDSGEELTIRRAEPDWEIAARRAQALEDLRIGPRQDDPFARAEAERALALKRIEEEAARRERLQLAYGESLLSRWGYYAPDGLWYIGSRTPYWVDGVGLSTGDVDFFVGSIGSGWYPYTWGSPYGWRGGRRYCGGWDGPGHPGSAAHQRGLSPGFRWGNFSFGTNLSPWGGCSSGWGGGYGFNFSGGSKNFRYNINAGGFSGGSWSHRHTGVGW